MDYTTKPFSFKDIPQDVLFEITKHVPSSSLGKLRQTEQHLRNYPSALQRSQMPIALQEHILYNGYNKFFDDAVSGGSFAISVTSGQNELLLLTQNDKPINVDISSIAGSLYNLKSNDRIYIVKPSNESNEYWIQFDEKPLSYLSVMYPDDIDSFSGRQVNCIISRKLTKYMEDTESHINVASNTYFNEILHILHNKMYYPYRYNLVREIFRC